MGAGVGVAVAVVGLGVGIAVAVADVSELQASSANRRNDITANPSNRA